MPAWLAALAPLLLEPAGQVMQPPPATLYWPVVHTAQSASVDELTADPVPAGQSTTPLPVVFVPTAPPPPQYWLAGHVTGVLLSGSPEM